MKRCLMATATLLLALAPITSNAVSPGNSDSYAGSGVSLEMTRLPGTVLNPGDEIGFRLVSEQDAYVIVFNIDTGGFVNLLYPAKGERPVHVRAGETYLIPDDNRELLVVEGNTGVEFIFVLAVPQRDDIDRRELDYLGKSNDLPRDERYRIDGDPFIAANIIAGELVRGISRIEGVFLDYNYFFINDRVTYPCYLCGECDGGQPDSDCSDYIIAANFDEERPFTYPLRRGYEMIEPAATPMLEDLDVSQSNDDRTFGQYESDDGTVNVNFYPYNSEVYYETRETLSGATDVNVYLYDPYWYDPYYAGWYYAPRYSVGFSWGYPSFWWGFNWGYWGGYYCSAWYWPRCYTYYDHYRYYSGYYDGGYRYRPEKYKDKYKGGDVGGGGSPAYKDKYRSRSNTYTTAYAQAAKRDSKLQLASGNLGKSNRSALGRVTSSKAYRNAKSRDSYKSYNKNTIVRNANRKPDSRAGNKYAQKSRNYTPRSRSSYGTKSATYKSRNRTGDAGYKSPAGKKNTSLKPRAKNYRNSTYRSGRTGGVKPKSRATTPKSRSSNRSYKGTTRSGTKNKGVKSNRGSSSKRTGKSSYKSPSRSSRSPNRSAVKSSRPSGSRSSARGTSGSRSGGGRSRSGGKARR